MMFSSGPVSCRSWAALSSVDYGSANVKMPPPDGIVTICLPFTAYVIAELDMSPPRLTRQSSSQLDAARFMSHER
jgi:hypothetical protein